MNLFEAVILGIVQGLTEFLPISSTAHLRIIPALAGWKDPGAAFTAIVQIGTLAAVLIYFFRDITAIVREVVAGILKGRPLGTTEAKMGWMIAAGTIPIVIFGLLFKNEIETSLRSLYWISGALIGLALLLTIAEKRMKNQLRQGVTMKSMENIGWKDALLIGLIQSIALIPGSSRSGVTITGGLFLNLSRETAARFSFLLSLPSVLAAGVFQLYKSWDLIISSPDNLIAIIVATIVSGIVGYASIAFLLNYLKSHTTSVFIIYRLLLGSGILLMLATGMLPAT
ncbi:MAG: undecaprenyl-diphosphatase UppP [Chlorobium limicola]|uniref:Undecaprenyl-diphosphatase n=1 Tax=Chlorobium limicola (strain DSM 245 / NBRC 103803 / 6330) TaxID=290315 RepID=UPPP_CHLL2|nr:undecaprenyl-diphosphatase UppP [Chlorobium limicola]B3EEG6.1 RecName: Full=Undecaprenyl-diphosphatase; AltName: Full=Bacitracin resistance protein; AltName: Full=Undecaprenyl pyrophosphate phosphatase [Chlorobium limicola DSM 245]ACD90776.1 undecaprenol kinase [Chlorobium limicola DSM 245]NTV21286.1 undecaprenyl-diphosphatase UppP [Chlorobium limicola]